MNIKKISAIVLTTAVVIATVGRVTAQIPPTEQLPFQPGQGQNTHQGLPEIPGLNLTDDQKNRLKEIHENTHSQLDQILTSDQKDQLKEAMQAHKNPQEAMESINLSSDQKNQLHDLMKSERNDVDHVLTSDQKETIKEWMKQHHPQGNMHPG